MKIVTIALVFVALSSVTFSQETLSKRAVYLEIGGSGIAASLNYEQTFWTRNNNAFSLRGGLGYFPLILNTNISLGTTSAILGANFSRNFKAHYLNIGISNALTSTFSKGIGSEFNSVSFSHLLIPAIGYRYQQPEKHKVFVGIGYSPLLSYDGISIENKMLQFKNHFYVSLGLNL